MRAFKRFVVSIILLGVTLFAQDVATITGFYGVADIQREGVGIAATLGAKLQEKDRIITQDETQVQIIFSDETVISVGKNTDFSINEYLFEDAQEPIAKFGMVKGAMRAITGKIAKVAPDKFSVQTRTATIGIRGTNFTLLAMEDGSHQAYCTFGAISVTIDKQEYLVKQGFFIDVTPSGEVKIKKFTPEDLKNMKKSSFASAKQNSGTSENKDDTTTRNDEEVEDDSQLDTTTTDSSGMLIKDVSDSWAESLQSSGTESSQSSGTESLIDNTETLTNSAVIAGYSMSEASYSGDYTTSYSTGVLDATGTATLDVNFYLDEATFTLNGENSYSVSNVSTNTFSGNQSTNNGVVNGSFYGNTGNIVKGDFTFYEGATAPVKTAEGTYSVTSSQTLH